MKKITFAALISALCLLVAAACTNNKTDKQLEERKDKLAAEIEAAQADMPMKTPVGYLTELTYDRGENQVRVRLAVDDIFGVEETSWDVEQRTMESKFKLMMCMPSMRTFTETVANADASLKWEVAAMVNGRSRLLEMTIGNAELRDCLASNLTDAAVKRKIHEIDFENINSTLPQDVDYDMTWAEANYLPDENVGEMVYELEFNNENGFAYITDNEQFKLGSTMMFANEQLRAAMGVFAAQGLNVRFTVRDTRSGRRLWADFTPAEVMRFNSSAPTEGQVGYDILKQTAEQENAALPQTVSDGMTLVSEVVDGPDFILTIVIDEDMFDFDYWYDSEFMAGLKSDLLAGLKEDAEMYAEISDYLKRVVYRYKGSASGRSVDCVIPTKEI